MTKTETIARIQQLVEQLQAQGFTLIDGYFEKGSIYNIVALVRRPEHWHPYKVIRDFGPEDLDALALYWSHNDEAALRNNAGTFIYCPTPPEDLEAGEEYQPQTDEPYCVLTWEEVADALAGTSDGFRENIRSRLNIFAAAQQTGLADSDLRWNLAPRIDHDLYAQQQAVSTDSDD